MRGRGCRGDHLTPFRDHSQAGYTGRLGNIQALYRDITAQTLVRAFADMLTCRRGISSPEAEGAAGQTSAPAQPNGSAVTVN
nr:hypothetical protein GCM10020063_055580 [Dactylosporangium thailandense]